MARSQLSRPGILALWLAIVVLGACAPLIAEYSLEAYKNATSLKAETLALVDKSGGRYSAHGKEVEALTTRINAAYEFAAGLANNAVAAQQWNVLRDPNGNLYGGFIATWRKQGRTSAAYRSAKKRQIGDAFDYIICLESNKKGSTTCAAAAAAAASGGS